MDITKIPFNKYLNIKETAEKDTLELCFHETMENHIGTFHASAQFALAEACSGLALQQQFSDLADSVVPVLRKSETKFKKPVSSDVHAKATISDEESNKFRQQFQRKGRASISVSVEIAADDGTVSMTGSYQWFVQKIES